MSGVVRVVAPAKVNLFLGVGGVRADGYHDVSTVLHALALSDRITITPSARLDVRCTPEVGIPAEDNLAYRAATALGQALGKTPSVLIEIEKHIPHGAGLGGGSSDAAAVVAGLAVSWGIDPLDPRCLSTARALGADVPFFLLGGAALMGGRGDVFERHLPALETPAVVIKPSGSVSTAEAYSTFDAAPLSAGSPDGVIAALRAGDGPATGAALANNMAPAARKLVPETGEALAMLAGADGVLGAEVAGSGSAVFALCESDIVAEQTAAAARERGWWAQPTALSASGVEIVEDWESS